MYIYGPTITCEGFLFFIKVYFVKIGQSVLARIKKSLCENAADASHRAACCAVKTAGRFYKESLTFSNIKKKKFGFTNVNLYSSCLCIFLCDSAFSLEIKMAS